MVIGGDAGSRDRESRPVEMIVVRVAVRVVPFAFVIVAIRFCKLLEPGRNLDILFIRGGSGAADAGICSTRGLGAPERMGGQRGTLPGSRYGAHGP